jgi:hypothetical protein
VLDGGVIVENLPVAQIGRARNAATLALLNALPAPPEVLLSYRDRSGIELPAPALCARY